MVLNAVPPAETCVHDELPILVGFRTEKDDLKPEPAPQAYMLPSLNNALYYHADYVYPNWKKPKIEQIGRHIFYGERK